MNLLNVCVGQPQRLPGKSARSGIDKRPVEGPVRVGPLGLGGDHVLNTKHHGGPDQAVYLYTDLDYDHWAQVLGERPAPGTFGENLLISGLESAPTAIGQRLRVGGVLLEVTASRIPCQTFAAHMGDPAFVKKFRAARRPGLYARVLEGGEVRAGDPVSLDGAPPPDAPTVLDTFEVHYARKVAAPQLRRLLAAPVAERLRRDLEARLLKLGETAEPADG